MHVQCMSANKKVRNEHEQLMAVVWEPLGGRLLRSNSKSVLVHVGKQMLGSGLSFRTKRTKESCAIARMKWQEQECVSGWQERVPLKDGETAVSSLIPCKHQYLLGKHRNVLIH